MERSGILQIIRATLLLYLIVAAPVAWAQSVPLTKTTTLQIGIYRVQAEIADTPQSRERGLMQRTHLCANCGMLFVFEEAAQHGFWMKNTPLPLSIAFINADGIILNIAEMQPHTTAIHHAKGNALYALEMSRGWFAKRRIKRGQVVQLPPKISAIKNPQ